MNTVQNSMSITTPLKSWRDYAIHDQEQIYGFFGIGADGYRWLSNFHPAQCWYNGKKFPTSEHAYQFAKLRRLYVDIPSDDYILECRDRLYRDVIHMTASQVKAWGQTISMRPDWEDVKISTMASIVWSKFYINEDLRTLLLNTGERQLVEANHWNDTFWGVDARTGTGLNMLGNTLMITRSYFRRLSILCEYPKCNAASLQPGR